MDFEDSVKRLAKDQSKVRGKRDLVISQKAKRQAEYQRKQAARLRAERERKKRLEEHQQKYMHGGDRSLQIKHLGSFSPTSIFGDGDKIALSPSVLEKLTSAESGDNNVGNPWTFRIGVLNPDYKFPSSPLIHTLKPPKDEDEDLMAVDSDDDDDNMEAYRDELKHKYLAYTHCTVVEFTQDEGHVGIPQPIAKALLEKNSSSNSSIKPIPIKRTVDPAGATEENTESSQTPGHLAWGAFDIPDMQLDITLLKLPKGKGCTLVPTKEAIQHGFYGLKDIKLVLEQSLIRTRATLSVGDIVNTWHRGVQFDLNVTKIIPATFNAVTSINTDIEVDFGQPELSPEEQQQQNAAQQSSSIEKPASPGRSLGSGGQTLGSSFTTGAAPAAVSSDQATTPAIDLLPEPPADQKEGVCLVQIQHTGGHGKRRLLTTEAKIQDLFAFASSLVGRSDFRLVTRFPRRVFTLSENQSSTLAEAGIQQGQERFMMEFL